MKDCCLMLCPVLVVDIVVVIVMFLSWSSLLWSSPKAKPTTTSFPYAKHLGLGLGAGLFLRFEILIVTAIG